MYVWPKHREESTRPFISFGNYDHPRSALRQPLSTMNNSLSLRPATKADLDAIASVVKAGFPDDPGCDYKFPYRNDFPDDFWKWTRLEYEEYLNQPEKFAVLVVTTPITNAEGAVIDTVIAIGVWDLAVLQKSKGGGSCSPPMFPPPVYD
jgi:hypothetical protein